MTWTLQCNHLKVPLHYSSKQETKLHLPFDQPRWFICLAGGVHAGSCLKYHLRWIIKNILLICPRQHFISSTCMRSVCSPWCPLHRLQQYKNIKELKSLCYFCYHAGSFRYFLTTHAFWATYTRTFEIKSCSKPELKSLFHSATTSSKYSSQKRQKDNFKKGGISLTNWSLLIQRCPHTASHICHGQIRDNQQKHKTINVPWIIGLWL